MKKIFILTGEPSGDLLASKVISKLQFQKKDIQYLSLGGENLKKIGIESIFNLEEVTFLGFTKVFFNIFKIKRKIKNTVNKIVEFEPDILFSVDSPDFTLRVAEQVKKLNSKIKTIHFVAPQVWVWREGRVKKIKKFIDHILLLFYFEKKYFDKEQVRNSFVGHPLLEENKKSKIDINQVIGKNKAIISVFSGSRIFEVETLVPILIKFIKLMNKKYEDFIYIFHTTKTTHNTVYKFLKESDLKNYEIISDPKIKEHIIEKSIFSVVKSGTISLEICAKKIPSIIIYKMNIVNFVILKLLVKVKFANIINIAANKMIIPELLQNDCNAINIFNKVSEYLEDEKKITNQILETQKVLQDLKVKDSPTSIAAEILKSHI